MFNSSTNSLLNKKKLILINIVMIFCFSLLISAIFSCSKKRSNTQNEEDVTKGEIVVTANKEVSAVVDTYIDWQAQFNSDNEKVKITKLKVNNLDKLNEDWSIEKNTFTCDQLTMKDSSCTLKMKFSPKKIYNNSTMKISFEYLVNNVAKQATMTITYSSKSQPIVDGNIVSVYLLIDNISTLRYFVKDFKENVVDKGGKANFNHLIISFIRPNFTKYTSGDLSNSGILGFFDEKYHPDSKDITGQQAFKELQDAIRLVKNGTNNNLKVFLALGGWNYSCKSNYYHEGQKKPEEQTGYYSPKYGVSLYCDSTNKDDRTKTRLDYFPDPKDDKDSYINFVKLAADLGVDGLDLDYEEFWHADSNAQPWCVCPWCQAATSITQDTPIMYNELLKAGSAKSRERFDRVIYGEATKTIINPWGEQANICGGEQKSAANLSYTVDKVEGIVKILVEEGKRKHKMMLSAAMPPVGASPTMSAVYGDTKEEIVFNGDKDRGNGGLWWGGNLKGLVYNLVFKNKDLYDEFDAIGVMTYDLNAGDYPYGIYQGADRVMLYKHVDAYMRQYHEFLKKDSKGKMVIDPKGRIVYTQSKFLTKPKLQFGLEVNMPPFPASEFKNTKDIDQAIKFADDDVRYTYCKDRPLKVDPLDEVTVEQGKNMKLTFVDPRKNACVLMLKESDIDIMISDANRRTDQGVIIWQLYSQQYIKGSGDLHDSGPTAQTVIQKSCKGFLKDTSKFNCDVNFPSVPPKPSDQAN